MLFEAIMNFLKINCMIILDDRFIIKGKYRVVLFNYSDQQQKKEFIYEKHYF
jgi:hypothetical protein